MSKDEIIGWCLVIAAFFVVAIAVGIAVTRPDVVPPPRSEREIRAIVQDEMRRSR